MSLCHSPTMSTYADIATNSPKDRSSTCISAFLSQIDLMPDCQPSDDFTVGRNAVEQLASAFGVSNDWYVWSIGQCAGVASFLSQVTAEPGACPMCEEGIPQVSAASGRIIVMTFLAEQIHAHASKPKGYSQRKSRTS